MLTHHALKQYCITHKTFSHIKSQKIQLGNVLGNFDEKEVKKDEFMEDHCRKSESKRKKKEKICKEKDIFNQIY